MGPEVGRSLTRKLKAFLCLKHPPNLTEETKMLMRVKADVANNISAFLKCIVRSYHKNSLFDEDDEGPHSCAIDNACCLITALAKAKIDIDQPIGTSIPVTSVTSLPSPHTTHTNTAQRPLSNYVQAAPNAVCYFGCVKIRFGARSNCWSASSRTRCAYWG